MVVVRKIVLWGMVLFGAWSGVTDISEEFTAFISRIQVKDWR